ncbi:ribosome recycling factor, partial [Treponema sp. R6D11]
MEFESKMDKAISILEEDYSTVRVGRANPKLLNKVEVDYYGSPTPITSVATVSVPEPRMLLIQPFDINSLGDIEAAIIAAEIGLSPANDGKVLRIVFPPLTEERRKEITKDLSKSAENTKIAIRNVRRDGMESYK